MIARAMGKGMRPMRLCYTIRKFVLHLFDLYLIR